MKVFDGWRGDSGRAAGHRKACVTQSVASMKERMESSSPSADSLAPAWPKAAKRVVSVLVALHVLAVFLAPMSFAVRPGSPAIDPLKQVFRPYIQALFLDHGYAFFAPDPGPSHLVQYTLKFDNGRQDERGRFPDIHQHWPRLLYHRHFMLSESLQTYYAPEQEPRFPNLSPQERHEELERWRVARQHFVKLRDSYARHLAHAHHARDAEVHRLRHDFLPPAQFTSEANLEGPVRMEDPRTYTDLDALPPPTNPTVEEFIPGLTPLPRGDR